MHQELMEDGLTAKAVGKEKPANKKRVIDKKFDRNGTNGVSKNENGKPAFERKRKVKSDATEGGVPPKKKPYSGNVDESGKPDWKKMREERKSLKESRKKKEMKEDFYETTKEVKAIWEEMRKQDCPKNVRDKHCVEIHNLIKNNVKKFAFAHDTTRVLESLLLYGSEIIRADIHDAFAAKEDILYLMKSKYGHYLALKLMKYSTTKQKDTIFAAMESHVVTLLRHQFASTVVNEFYQHYAKATHKAAIVKECYGSLMRLEKANLDMKKSIEKFPERKQMIMKSVQSIISSMLDKGLKDNIILQYLIHEYLENCEHTERTELIDTMTEQLKEDGDKEKLKKLYKTNEGSLLLMSCIWHGTRKNRKLLIKSLKGNISDMACNKYGYRILLAVFDTVDDTVLVSKGICQELTSDISVIVMNQFGQRVIVYLMNHRTPLFFDPETVKLLKLGDDNEHTKKPIESRVKDVSEGLYKELTDGIEENFGIWVQNNSACLLVKFILERYQDKPLYSALKKIAAVVSETETHINKKAVAEMLLKYILTNLNEENRKTFSAILLDGVVNADLVEQWLKSNRGCFTFLKIWEKVGEEQGSRVAKLVKEHKGIIEETPTAGGKLLVEKILKD